MKPTCLLLIALSIALNTIRTQAQSEVAWPPDPSALFPKSVKIVKSQLLVTGAQASYTKTRCGTILNADDASTWVLIKTSRDDRYYLCNLATGTDSQALPNDYDWSIQNYNSSIFNSADGYPVEVSPDSNWLLLRASMKGAATDNPYYPPISLLSYQIKTGQLLNLGSDFFVFEDHAQWATNTDYFIETRDMPEWSTASAYVVDVTRANSLRKVLTSLRWHIFYADNPPRLEAVDTPSNSLSMADAPVPDCTRSIYYFKTQSVRTYDYGDLCLTEYGPVDGTGYYRHILPNGLAGLVRYNPIAKQRAELYRGEIERVFWVSTDEHFAALGLDNNGKIDDRPGFENDGTLDYLNVSNPTLAVVDLKTKSILFRTDDEAGDLLNGAFVSPHDPKTVNQLDQNTLLLTTRLNDGDQPPRWRFTVVSLKSGKTRSQELPGELTEQIVPGGGLLYFPNDYLKSTALVLYYPLTGQTVPIVQDVKGYLTQIQSLDGNLLTLSIGLASEWPHNFTRLAQYTLQIP